MAPDIRDVDDVTRSSLNGLRQTMALVPSLNCRWRSLPLATDSAVIPEAA